MNTETPTLIPSARACNILGMRKGSGTQCGPRLIEMGLTAHGRTREGSYMFDEAEVLALRDKLGNKVECRTTVKTNELALLRGIDHKLNFIIERLKEAGK